MSARMANGSTQGGRLRRQVPGTPPSRGERSDPVGDRVEEGAPLARARRLGHRTVEQVGQAPRITSSETEEQAARADRDGGTDGQDQPDEGEVVGGESRCGEAGRPASPPLDRCAEAAVEHRRPGYQGRRQRRAHPVTDTGARCTDGPTALDTGGSVSDGEELSDRQDPQRGPGGPRGAGKTTLAEALLSRRRHQPRLGRVEDGTTVSDFDPEEAQAQDLVSLALAPFECDGGGTRSTSSTRPATPTSWATWTRRCGRRPRRLRGERGRGRRGADRGALAALRRPACPAWSS